jgi:stress responsive alpha/beta barrel protein
MFIHSVYFWLKPDLSDEARRRYISGLRSLLTIDTVQAGYIGLPADTRRPVVDHTYSHALVLMFRDASAHERYQLDPIHDRFRTECRDCWDRVVIYDCVTGAEAL